MISLATETDRTLFFDFLPLDLGTIRGFKTGSTSTRSGQVFYDAFARLSSRAADGVVFVRGLPEFAARGESRVDLEPSGNSRAISSRSEEPIPYVLQLNKRDLPGSSRSLSFAKQLQFRDEPVIEAVAACGIGVFETLKAVAMQVLRACRNPRRRPGLDPSRKRRNIPRS